MACPRPTATRRRQEERDQLGQDEEAKQQEGWAAGLCLRGGARRAPGEGPEAAGPRATAGASTDGVVCRRRRTLPRLPRARVLRAGRRLGEVGGREWPVQAGDAYVISPGEVVGVGDAGGFERVEGWAAFFPPEVLGLQAPSAFLSWRAHPLLFPFVRGAGNPGAQRLRVPPAERASWSERFATLDAELLQRRDGYREAALSHLTLLLVELSRLAVDVVGAPQAQGRAPHRRGIRLHRGTLPRADLAQGRPKGRGSLAGAPHHSRWAQDRADGSGVDRRTPHGGGAQVAG